MTAVTTAPAATDLAASVLNARDFSSKTTDVLRDTWTRGKMRHAIAAIGDGPVVITLDGLAFFGVTLVGERENTHGGGQGRVLVRFASGDVTAYRLEEVGQVIAVGNTRARHEAITSYRAEVTAAIQEASRLHGKAEGRAWGEWTGEVAPQGGVFVRYTPHTGNPAFADQWGTRWSGHVYPETTIAERPSSERARAFHAEALKAALTQAWGPRTSS